MNKLFLFVLLGICHLSSAQGPTTPQEDQHLKGTDYDWSWKTSSTPSFTPPPPDPIPIDGGVGFLLVAGAGMGLQTLKKRRKNK